MGLSDVNMGPPTRFSVLGPYLLASELPVPPRETTWYSGECWIWNLGNESGLSLQYVVIFNQDSSEFSICSSLKRGVKNS